MSFRDEKLKAELERVERESEEGFNKTVREGPERKVDYYEVCSVCGTLFELGGRCPVCELTLEDVKGLYSKFKVE